MSQISTSSAKHELSELTASLSKLSTRTEDKHVLSIDVESVATGYSHLHSDRCPFQVSVVNGSGDVLYTSYIKPDREVVSYLTPLTGIKKDDVDIKQAPTLQEVLKKVHSLCSPSTILVGQFPHGDIRWLQLEKGKHYGEIVDIATWFQATKYGKPMHFSLAHESKVLLNEIQGDVHCPTRDAQLTLKLYHKYKNATSTELAQVRRRLLQAPRTTSAAYLLNFYHEGVCLSAFSARTCRCGKPLLSTLY